MNENCEPFETLVSTWLDEGLDREDQTELLDHLARCAGCRSFYRETRSLEGFVAMAEPPEAREPAPEAVWERIERQAWVEAPAAGSGRWMRWGLAAAAALLIGIALPLIPWPTGGASTANAPIEIRLEENREDMTETRFVELTTELLQADRKYHFAMQDVMEAVIEGSWEAEGASSEGDVEEGGGEDDGDRSSRVRT